MSSNGLTPETGLRAPRQSLLNPPQTIATSPFLDHTGNAAISAYHGHSPTPGAPILPPLWSFHYYITFGATPSTSPILPSALIKATKSPLLEPYPFRLDIYFLPGASTEDCMAHYRAERASRLSAAPPRNFIETYRDPASAFNWLAQIEDPEWELEGATGVMFDMTPRILDDDEPPATSIECGVPLGGGGLDSVGMFLDSMAGGTGRDEMTDAYEERLSGGHSDWARSLVDCARPCRCWRRHRRERCNRGCRQNAKGTVRGSRQNCPILHFEPVWEYNRDFSSAAIIPPGLVTSFVVQNRDPNMQNQRKRRSSCKQSRAKAKHPTTSYPNKRNPSRKSHLISRPFRTPAIER
jgi:hypothetical protein